MSRACGGEQVELTVISDNGAESRLSCAGKVCQEDTSAGLDRFVDSLGPGAFSRRVLLDLSSASWIDSSGIAWLISAHRAFLRAGGKLILHSLPARIDEIIDLMRIKPLLTIAGDEAAARTIAGGASA